MELIIKKFNAFSAEELYEILAERINVFVVEQKCPYPELDGKDNQAVHMYYRKDGKIAAYLRILLAGVSYDEVSIGRVLVHPDFRMHGLAKKLMLEALRYVKDEMNEQKIRISAQAYLLDFYKSLGFKPVSEVYLEDDIPHIEMLFA